MVNPKEAFICHAESLTGAHVNFWKSPRQASIPILDSASSLTFCIILLFLFLVYYQRGFVEAHADDGLLEIFGLKQGCHASFVMVELISAKHIAQVQYLI
jgi:hypothetical protein